MTRLREASACAWGLALVVSVVVLLPSRAGADPADEGLMFNQLNTARAQNRLGCLGRSGELDGVARRHAARMAAAPHPFHNPNLRAETPGWPAIGEVVGRIGAGPGWDSALQRLFLSSPVHRAVMLSPGYTVVGIGTARSANGDVNAVEVFGRSSACRTARPPAPARAARAARAVARPAPTPPTTAPPPPTTTTTTQPLSRIALAPLPHGPHTVVVLTDADEHARQPSKPLAVGATGAQVVALGALVSCATRSRRGGRRRPSC
jgi:hypothetical protein